MSDTKMFHAKLLWVALALAVFASARLAPPLDGLTPLGQSVLGAVLAGTILWVSEAIPLGLTALLVTALLGLCPGLRLPDVVNGFAGEVVFFLIGAVGLGAAVESSGLAARAARFLSRSARGSPARLYVQMIAGFPVLALLIPSAITRNAVLIPAYRDALGAMGLDQSSRTGRAIMLALGILNPLASSAFLTGGITSITAATLIGGFSWLGWFSLMAVPYYALLCGGAILLWVLVGGFESTGHVREAERARQPYAAAEKRTLVVLVLTATLWLTDSLHQLSPAIPAMIGAAILLLPGVGVISWKTFETRLSWGLILTVGTSLSLATLMTSTGAAAWLGQLLLGHLSGLASAPLLLIAALIVAAVLVHLAITNLAACIALLLPINATVATAAGLNPTVTALALTIAVDAVILYPVQTAANLMAYEAGYFRRTDVVKMGVGMLVLTLTVVMLVIPYWSMLGLTLRAQ
ncbi:SLC13 family permease [Hyphomicrobium sp. CS1BSMeth3]|uniref:SLC13 family permease n=1 Tax=Hyphomicrobium sp. CS1BSMeth3 TaxID=1892844 RepID=UPI0009307307|nr:SLC13 family permease [Hyphomicrobium sp. CS1BSMeth3]